MTGGKCFYCGNPVISEKLEVDRDWLTISSANRKMACEHKIPVIRGGANHKSNYVPACLACNNTKGAFTIDEYRFLSALRNGDLNFAFPFEQPPVVRRDWLLCHSSEKFERALMLTNMPTSAAGYAARRPVSARRREERAAKK